MKIIVSNITLDKYNKIKGLVIKDLTRDERLWLMRAGLKVDNKELREKLQYIEFRESETFSMKEIQELHTALDDSYCDFVTALDYEDDIEEESKEDDYFETCLKRTLMKYELVNMQVVCNMNRQLEEL